MDIFEHKNTVGAAPVLPEEEAPERAVITDKARRHSPRLKAVLTAIAVLFCFSGAIAAAAVSGVVEPEVYAYSLQADGEEIAVFTSYEEAQTAVAAYKTQLDAYYDCPLHFAQTVSVNRIDGRGVPCETAGSAAADIEATLTPVTDAYGIYIDGIFCLAVASEEEAEAVLDAVKAHYSEERKNIAEVAFAEEIEILPLAIEPAQLTSADEAYDYLLNHRYAAPVYTVEQAGETLYDIADKFGADIGVLVALNTYSPDSALDKGVSITLAEAEAPLTVVLKRIVAVKETVPYQTVKLDNPDEVRGLEKVLQEGSDGLNAVVYTVTEKNGAVASRELIGREEIQPVQDYIVERGTKAVVASRYFNRSLNYGQPEIEQELIWPLHGIITDSFGARRSGGVHTGLDIAVGRGTEVKAMADGVVVFSEYESSYGNIIKIDHGNGVETWYAHLSTRKVKLGDVVSQGDVIALSGNTGRSSGPHLHVELRIDTQAYNVLKFLPEE